MLGHMQSFSITDTKWKLDVEVQVQHGSSLAIVSLSIEMPVGHMDSQSRICRSYISPEPSGTESCFVKCLGVRLLRLR
jgi:hypothetical protein